MLSRQLSQVSSWRRSSVCLLCALRSQIQLPLCRPFSATSAVLKLDRTPKISKTSKISKTPRIRITRGKKDISSRAPGDKAGKSLGESGELDEGLVAEEEGGSGWTESVQSIKDALLGTKEERRKRGDKARETARETLAISTMDPDKLEFEAVQVEKPPVPMLSYGLDRVLFNPGVYRLQDPRSRVYNFDPYLEKIMPANEFDFDALSEYKTSSKDEELLALTKRVGAKFTGSTSSMSSMLQHFHFVLSDFRRLNHSMMSRQFPEPSGKFSKITVGPSAVFLRLKDGVYAIDADKSYDKPNIMSWLGHSMEKLLTTERSEFERYRRSSSEKAPAEDNSSRCYHYSKQGNIMMRSQLDAVDPRLPGTGVFDLKTRAVVSIRMNHREYEEGQGYQLRHALGEWESFEREFYDMTRATMLKYSLQVRMGRMDGIFLAYHNIERIFGFQYLSLSDMDAVLHGQHNTNLGDMEFKLSVGLVDELLAKATAQFPDTSIRLHFEARESKTPFMYVFAEPVTEEQADEIQNAGEAAQREFARTVIGLDKGDPEAQAGWEDIQDDVDEQLHEDQNSTPEKTGNRNVVQLEESETASGNSSEGIVEETPTNTEDSSDSVPVSEGPLMGWTLAVRNLVNGGYVQRPEKLGNEDEWKMEYHIKEIPEGTRWKLYNALKDRRRQLIGQDEEEANKGLQHYRDLIKRFTNRGRRWREEQDKLDDAKPGQLFRPLGPSGSDGAELYNEVTKVDESSNDVTTAEEPLDENTTVEESSNDDKQAAESLSQEKKAEVLDGMPASPS